MRRFLHIFIETKTIWHINISIINLVRILKILDNKPRLNTKTENVDYNLHTSLYLMTIIARIFFSSDEKQKQQVSVDDDNRTLFKLIRTIIQHE